MAKKRIPVDIIVRSLQENMDESGRAELDSWLGQSGNRDIYEGLAGLWDDVRREASGYEPDGRRLWRRLQEHSGKSRTARRLLLGISAAAAVVLVFLSGLMLRYLPVGGPDPVVMSSVCGKSRNVLPDGTVVWLKDGSSLEYDAVSFGRKDRKVLLKGEAYFDVRKNPKKTFYVHVENLSVEVTGTEFNVRECSDRIYVSLVEGAVKLSASSGQPVSITAGQKAVYDKRKGTIACESGEIAPDACWASCSLNFKAQPLGRICQHLSVWYGVKIIPVPALENEYAYTFTVTDEPLDEILAIMGKINPIEYVKTGNVYRITELKQ